jgi:hypothetical protein
LIRADLGPPLPEARTCDALSARGLAAYCLQGKARARSHKSKTRQAAGLHSGPVKEPKLISGRTSFPQTGPKTQGRFLPWARYARAEPLPGGLAAASQGEALSIRNHLRPRREKVFQNHETRVPLDREAKVRIAHLARALKRRTEPGRHYGVLTGKCVDDVLHALLWLIHDGRSGQCNPSLETIADKAGCARSTVCRAIAALESAGILSWVNRITRIRVRERDLLGQWSTSWRVVRTSNAYVFRDPRTRGCGGNPSKSDFRSGPLDTSLKQEGGSGARLVGAPVYAVGETADDLLMRHGWFRGGGRR